MKFRRFTDDGLTQFRVFLDRLKTEDPKLDPPTDLLMGKRFTEELDPAIELKPQPFARRMDFACWLDGAAGDRLPRQDVHFWAWLSLALFDQVCPKNGHGKRTAREDAWYIPRFEDRQRNYRHVLFGSYLIYRLAKDQDADASVLLSNRLDKLGHFWYQIASRQDLIGNPSVVGAASQLYFDASKGRAKVGAVSKKPGSVFRFVKLLNQFDRVWDLRLRGVDGIIALLPQEFDDFHAD
jgi:hypothetical protein